MALLIPTLIWPPGRLQRMLWTAMRVMNSTTCSRMYRNAAKIVCGRLRTPSNKSRVSSRSLGSRRRVLGRVAAFLRVRASRLLQLCLSQYSSTSISGCARGSATLNQINGNNGLGNQYIQAKLRMRLPSSRCRSIHTYKNLYRHSPGT